MNAAATLLKTIELTLCTGHHSSEATGDNKTVLRIIPLVVDELLDALQPIDPSDTSEEALEKIKDDIRITEAAVAEWKKATAMLEEAQEDRKKAIEEAERMWASGKQARVERVCCVSCEGANVARSVWEGANVAVEIKRDLDGKQGRDREVPGKPSTKVW